MTEQDPLEARMSYAFDEFVKAMELYANPDTREKAVHKLNQTRNLLFSVVNGYYRIKEGLEPFPDKQNPDKVMTDL